ncbi:hypothetical protein HYV21_00840 [Candidatus Microgenomates bacterium]|nr:hypothetical protein [Candidatus Microgenomates bacterium]
MKRRKEMKIRVRVVEIIRIFFFLAIGVLVVLAARGVISFELLAKALVVLIVFVVAGIFVTVRIGSR